MSVVLGVMNQDLLNAESNTVEFWEAYWASVDNDIQERTW